jgi:hypothetical protein
VTRFDLVAVGWGSLAASVGLLAGAGRDWGVRLAIAAAAFAVGGLLAGVRADSRRRLHSLAAGVGGYAIHAVFIALAGAIDAFGGPAGPALVRGSSERWAMAAAWALCFALMGGAVADALLRPTGRRRRRLGA